MRKLIVAFRNLPTHSGSLKLEETRSGTRMVLQARLSETSKMCDECSRPYMDVTVLLLQLALLVRINRFVPGLQ